MTIAGASLDPRALAAFAKEVRGDYERDLRTLVEIATVSADPARRGEVGRAAAAASGLIRRLGGRAEIHTTRGVPLVVGELGAGRGLPTVTLYNHLDVQPAAREEGWRTDPFRFVRKGDRYFGRGTTDDKGPALCALYGALAARRGGVAVKVRFLWEFEEEVGSRHFEEAIARLSPRLATDLVVVSDALWLSRRRPTSIAGLRGWVGFRFVLETARGDAHSGIVGGLARNPIAELMQLCAEMHDARTGRVKIPGFYDDVAALSRSERSDLRRSGFSLSGLARDLGLRRLRTRDSMEAMERIWTRPTFEVHGVVGGYTGPGQKSIVPGRAEVRASCRLVPRQRPERVVALMRRFVQRRNRDVVVRPDGGACAPYRGVVSGPLAGALRRAMTAAFGREPSFVRGGGTIGAVSAMERVLRCPVLFLDLSLPEHAYHGVDENFDWGQASGGIVAFARLLAELADLNTIREGGVRRA